jgi:hypothetical protein
MLPQAWQNTVTRKDDNKNVSIHTWWSILWQCSEAEQKGLKFPSIRKIRYEKGLCLDKFIQ